jgi:hypothetical protein
MPRKPKLFDYSQLSDFREYAPLNSDPTDFDVSRVTEKNRRDCTTPLDLISGVDETDWGYPRRLWFATIAAGGVSTPLDPTETAFLNGSGYPLPYGGTISVILHCPLMHCDASFRRECNCWWT